MVRYLKPILSACLSLLLLASCAQSKAPEKMPTYPHSDIDIKYSVRHFEADVTQSVEKFTGNYITQQQLERIVQTRFVSLLKENNLLASDSDVNVVDLDIFVDYSRRFVGDETPFPAPKLVAPIISLHEASYLGDVVIRHKITTGLALKDIFNGLTTHNVELEYKTADAIANSLLLRLKSINQYDKNAFAAMTSGMTPQQIEKKRQYTPKVALTTVKPVGLTTEQYLPEELIQGYLSSLAQGDTAARIAVYKQLIAEWVNSTAVYDVINERVLANYQNTTDMGEMIWAIKALAYSGLERYRSTLDTVLQGNTPPKLQNYVEDYLSAMATRIEQARVIHDISTMSPELDWQTNQLLNMLRSSDADLRLYAVKQTYKQHLTNETLLDELSRILQQEAKIPRHRYGKFVDFHAWSCRVLGSSGNSKYKSVLTDLAENAHMYKVREFAEKFGKKL